MVASRIRRSTVIAAAGLAMVAAGCGVSVGSGSGGSGMQVQAGSFAGSAGGSVLARSAASTAKVKSMRLTLTETVEGMGPRSVSFSATGEFDNVAHRGHMSLDMNALGSRAGSIEEVVDGTTVYMRSTLLGSLGGSGKPWAKIDVGSLVGSKVLSSGAYSSGANPGAFLGFLKDAGAKITTIGSEKVRGVDTTHVHSVVDLEQLLHAAPPQEAKVLQQELGSLGAGGVGLTKLPIDAWVGHDGYVRRVSLTFDFAGLAGAAPQLSGAKISVTMEMYDFGQPVHITVPDPSLVGPLPASACGCVKPHN